MGKKFSQEEGLAIKPQPHVSGIADLETLLAAIWKDLGKSKEEKF
jgi:hypothetical protein